MRLEDIKVGDTMFMVKRTYGEYKEQVRIIDGETWYRRESRESKYEVLELTLKGMLRPTFEGDVPTAHKEERHEYAILFFEEIDYEIDGYMIGSLFKTREEAEEEVKKLVE